MAARREPWQWPMTHRHLHGEYVEERNGTIVGWDADHPGRVLLRLRDGSFDHYDLPDYEPQSPPKEAVMYGKRKSNTWKWVTVIVILAVLAFVLL